MYTNIEDFKEYFGLPEDYEIKTYELLEDLAIEEIKYYSIIFPTLQEFQDNKSLEVFQIEAIKKAIYWQIKFIHENENYFIKGIESSGLNKVSISKFSYDIESAKITRDNSLNNNARRFIDTSLLRSMAIESTQRGCNGHFTYS